MSAELLREAASLMRERAEAATSGPWVAAEVYGLPMVFDSAAIPEPVVYDQELTATNAEHIASWHPDVALAVADWLDMQAGCVANYGPNADSPWVKPHTQMALAVACAYLGSAS